MDKITPDSYNWRRCEPGCQGSASEAQCVWKGCLTWYAWYVARLINDTLLVMVMHVIYLPAEEGGAGKVFLLERGGYKEMDACLMYRL